MDTETDITRRQALSQLLSIPDPPEMHRANRIRCEGKADRHEQLPILAAAFVRLKMIEFRSRTTR